MILSLDLATQTGWCAGSGEQLPELGTVKMPETGEDIGEFGYFFEEWLKRHLLEIQPTIVTFEAPLLPHAKIDRDTGRLIQAPTTDATQTKLKGLKWATEVICKRSGIECAEAWGSTVKKGLAGSGRAQKTDMMAAAKKCGLNPKTFDEADAFGVWIVSVRAYAKHYGHRWDQLLYGGRGAML